MEMIGGILVQARKWGAKPKKRVVVDSCFGLFGSYFMLGLNSSSRSKEKRKKSLRISLGCETVYLLYCAPSLQIITSSSCTNNGKRKDIFPIWY